MADDLNNRGPQDRARRHVPLRSALSAPSCAITLSLGERHSQVSPILCSSSSPSVRISRVTAEVPRCPVRQERGERYRPVELFLEDNPFVVQIHGALLGIFSASIGQPPVFFEL